MLTARDDNPLKSQPGLPGISIRAAAPGDAQPASQLIYATGPAYFDTVLGLGDSRRAIGTIARLFVLPGNRFSYRLSDVAEINGEVAGILVSFPGKQLFRLNMATGRQFMPLFPWRDRLRLGMAALLFIGDKEAEASHYLISHLAVTPACWGQGIGTRLLALADVKARALGIKICTLNVDLDNPRARRLYTHVGYQVAETTQYPEKTAKKIGPGFERLVKDASA